MRNLATGQVEVIAEGFRPDLQELLSALRQGPPGARVSNIQVSWPEPQGDLGPFTVAPSA